MKPPLISPFFWLWLLVLVAALAACQEQPPAPSPPNEASHYFAQTGQTVQGDFWLFYQRYGGVESLGYPLTGEITADGWRAQYFEKGRLEYHPENEPAYRVTVDWLGDLLHRRQPPLPPGQIPPADDPNRRYFAETGHTLNGDFLSYFEANGGKVRFGWPISEPFLLEGRLTQDFQSTRFFWTPQANPPVTLEDTGQVYLEIGGK